MIEGRIQINLEAQGFFTIRLLKYCNLSMWNIIQYKIITQISNRIDLKIVQQFIIYIFICYCKLFSIEYNMSNVHGLGDFSPESANQMRRNQPPHNTRRQQRDNGFAGENGVDNWNFNMENLRSVEVHKVLFISGNTKIKNPKDENYFDMLKITCCPVIRLFSITLLLLLCVLGMYIASLVMGIDKEKKLLQIKATVLLQLGANYSPFVKDGQVWRLISAQFLHINFIHLVGNLLTILIFVSRVEYTFGWWKTFFIYIISGIGGNIFSILINPSDTIVKAGASTSLYGIIGTIFGYIIINWRGLDIIGRLLKCQLVFVALMIVMFIFVLTPYSDNIDYMGHLGGFLTGLTICAIHSTIRNDKREKIMRVIMLTICVGLLALWFILFYLRK